MPLFDRRFIESDDMNYIVYKEQGPKIERQEMYQYAFCQVSEAYRVHLSPFRLSPFKLVMERLESKLMADLLVSVHVCVCVCTRKKK